MAREMRANMYSNPEGAWRNEGKREREIRAVWPGGATERSNAKKLACGIVTQLTQSKIQQEPRSCSQ